MVLAALSGLSVRAQTLPPPPAPPTLFGPGTAPSSGSSVPVYPGLDPALLQQLQMPNIVPPFSIRATPESPSPGESVKIEAKPSTFETQSADFQWTVNGRRRTDLSGVGRNIFNLNAGKVGSIVRVRVEAREPDGTSHSAEASIHVSDLAIEWSAHTYTPKWYKGRALPIRGSFVTISAIPSFMLDNAFIPARSLIYTWFVDGQEALKGAGEQVLVTQHSSFPRTSRTVIVRVEDRDGRIRKEARLGLVPREPAASIYRTTPLGGIEPRQSMTVSSNPGEIFDVQAEPFYFNTQTRDDLTFQWRVNGAIQKSETVEPHQLSISTAGNTNPIVSVSAFIQHPGPFTSSSASKSLILLFSGIRQTPTEE